LQRLKIATVGGFDAQTLVASVKSVQDILQKCNEAASNSDLSPAIGEVSGLMTAVQKLTDSLDAMEKAAGEVDLAKTFTDSLPSIQTFSTELRKVLDALSGIQGSGSSFALSLQVPEEPFKNLTEKIATLTSIFRIRGMSNTSVSPFKTGTAIR